ncbi:MAG: SDR family oxidoreductase [Candidatus Aminicenantes bacterium]|nr:SDR family oxidoreductase [Candidatus Aminicenantes bacterium]
MCENSQLAELISLKGQVAVITGAASGIGRATAVRLAEAEAAVALLDVDETSGEAVKKEINFSGGKANFYRCDVTSNEECRSAVEKIISDFGRIDILFNNAGVIRRKSLVELNEEEWDLVLNVNLKAIYLLSRYVIPHMAKNGGGSIINTGSGWGLRGGARAAAYCASMGGTVNLTRAMAIDHGRDNIRVNCVCPGDTDTPLLHSEAAQLGEEKEKFLKEAAARPLERIGQPLDIANTVLYLAGGLSSWVTGSVLAVDGGGTA